MPEREFHFTQADFERIRKLIHQQAGISLAPIKQDMVYSRLARRLRALGRSPSICRCSKPAILRSGKPLSIR
jgi:hypothetical protein